MRRKRITVCVVYDLVKTESASFGTGDRRASSSGNWHVPNMRGFVGSQGGRGHKTHRAKARRARHVQTFAWPVSTELPEPIPMHMFIIYPLIHSSILSPTHCPSTHSNHPVGQLILGNHYVQSPGINTSKKILKIKGIILFTIYTYISHTHIYHTHIAYICIYKHILTTHIGHSHIHINTYPPNILNLERLSQWTWLASLIYLPCQPLGFCESQAWSQSCDCYTSEAEARGSSIRGQMDYTTSPVQKRKPAPWDDRVTFPPRFFLLKQTRIQAGLSPSLSHISVFIKYLTFLNFNDIASKLLQNNLFVHHCMNFTLQTDRVT